jgi:two-component system, chemotaxis family, CheB/CheR fusion protein
VGHPDDSERGRPVTTEAIPVVGIGASAGGIDALQQFLPAVAPDAAMAFVVVQHLAPDQPSTLSEILQRISPLPVTVAEDGIVVEPRHVYVIPPNATLTIEDGRLHVEEPTERTSRPNPAASARRSTASSPRLRKAEASAPLASSCRGPAATAPSACARSRRAAG